VADLCGTGGDPRDRSTQRRQAGHPAKLVTRHRWRRQKDNRGVLRILVPTDWATSKDKGTDRATDTAPDLGTDRNERIAQAEARVDEANKRADVAMALADRALAQLADAAERGDRLERDLVAALSAADAARAEAQAVQGEAAALRQEGERATALITGLTGDLASAVTRAAEGGRRRGAAAG
jgi:chromosome segregation ATPase